MSSAVLRTPPLVEPISVSEIREYLRLEESADDALLATLITAARQWAERYTGRAFITQGWRLWEHCWPQQGDSVELPHPQLIAVTAVTVYDDSDNAVIWNASNYLIDTADAPGRLVRRISAEWPLATRASNAIAIDYTAGYGAAADVPEPIRLAIRQLAVAWYENRGDGDPATAGIPAIVPGLLSPYRITRLA